ncbi:hypothetical protein [uncultured Methanobacterium sp.]|uniref:hypothetical protein n=1 Tax=uncultured Methanobacterium sp. TaxID=176306 RepID=UPI002AA848B6|nr:hypothetical protein [uncultured Methanobacterium sp.]
MLAIPLLGIIVIVVGYFSYTSVINGNEKNTQISSALKVSNVTNNGTFIKISYSGNWEGEIKAFVNGSATTSGNTKTYNGGSSVRSEVSGTGDKSYIVLGDLTGIDLSISKNDPGTNPLKVQLIQDGAVIQSQETSETGGTVKIKYGESVPMM